MTSLSTQLHNLIKPGISTPGQLEAKWKPSFLFDGKLASEVDRETISALGKNGFEELLKLNQSFAPYENLVFNTSYVTKDRELLTQVQNDQLSNDINNFLRLLSPYFLLRSAQKAFEWLVAIHKIQHFNLSAITECIMPYYRTNLFVRVIQLLPLGVRYSDLLWLKGIQKSATPLSHTDLINHCLKENSFLHFICNSITELYHLYSSVDNPPSLHNYINLYLTTVVGVINRVRYLVSESIIQILLPSAIDGLKSASADYQSASICIISCLVNKSVLTPEVCRALLLALCRCVGMCQKESVGCILIILRHQESASLTSKCIQALSNKADLHTILYAMAGEDIATEAITHPLMKHYMLHLISGCEETKLVSDTLVYLLQNLPLHTNSVINDVIELVVHTYGNTVNGADSQDELCEMMLKIGKILFTKYHQATKEVIDRDIQILDKDRNNDVISEDHYNTKFRHLQNFISSIYSDVTELEVSHETHLFLKLNNADPHSRRAAVSHLTEMIETASDEAGRSAFICDSLKERLLDDDPDVLLSVLKIGPAIFQLTAPSFIIPRLLEIAQYVYINQYKPWRGCVLEAIVLLATHGCLDSSYSYIVALSLLDLACIKLPAIKFRYRILAVLRDVTAPHYLLSGINQLLADTMSDLSNETPIEIIADLYISIINRVACNVTRCDIHEIMALFEYFHVSFKEKRHISLILSLTGLLLQDAKHNSTDFLCISQLCANLLINSDVISNILRDTVQFGHEQLIMTDLRSILAHSITNSQVSTALTQCRLSLWLIYNTITLLNPVLTEEHVFTWCVVSNMDHIDSSSQLYRIYELIISLTLLIIELDTTQSVFSLSYKQLIQQVLAIHLTHVNEFFTFIINLYIRALTTRTIIESDRNFSPQISNYILRMLRSFLSVIVSDSKSTSRLKLIDAATHHTPLMPVLLLQLADVNPTVRTEALSCLSILFPAEKQSPRRSTHVSPYKEFVVRVLLSILDIESDSTVIMRMLAEYASNTSTTTGKRKSMNNANDDIKACIKLILELTCNINSPAVIITYLLDLLQYVDSHSSYTYLIVLLQRCYDSPELYGKHLTDIITKLSRVFTVSIATFLNETSQGVKLFCHFLSSPSLTVQSRFLSQLTSEFFSSLLEPTQFAMLDSLFSILIGRQHIYNDIIMNKTKDAVTSTLTLTHSHVEYLLVTYAQLDLKTDTQITANSVKKARLTEVANNSSSKDLISTGNMISSLLELLLVANIYCPEDNLALYFQLMSLFQIWSSEISALSIDYNLNLLLSLMTKSAENISQDRVSLYEDNIDISRVLTVIQNSLDTHVQVQAYKLLSHVAKLMPDRVIHSIMPIFTFMGSHLIRNDDSHSFNVIITAIDTLIPPLINIEGANKPVLDLVRAVLQVFVDAFAHVPSHRRLSLFVHLITVIGAVDYMYVLLVLFCCNEVKDASRTKNRTLFCRSLLANLDLSTQLSSLMETLSYLTDLPVTLDLSDDVTTSNDKLQIVKDLKQEDVSDLWACVLQFVTDYIHNKQFVKRVDADRNSTSKLTTDEHFYAILSVLLCLIDKLGQENLSTLVYNILDGLLALLNIEQFVTIIKRLASGEDPTMTDRILALLLEKLENWHSTDKLKNYSKLADLLPVLIKLGCRGSSRPVRRQSALHSLMLIMRGLGPRKPQIFVGLEYKLLKSLTKLKNSTSLECISTILLCLSELITVIRVQLIPLLPRLVPTILTQYNESMNKKHNSVAYCCLCVIYQLSVCLPNFLSPYLNEILIISITLSSVDTSKQDTGNLLLKIRTSLAGGVSSRVLMTRIENLFSQISSSASDQMLLLLSLLEQTIQSISKEDIISSNSQLMRILLNCLDVRSGTTQDVLISENTVLNIEESSYSAFIAFILKLSETAFKPIFMDLREWATQLNAPDDRLIAFFTLSAKLAIKLKSIFSIYFIYLAEISAQTLARCHSNCDDEVQLFSDNSASEREYKKRLLTDNILLCIENCLKYDQDNIMNKEYFDILKTPLINQLTNLVGGNDCYKDRIVSHFIPCVLQFAIRANSEACRRQLTNELLVRSQDELSNTRFATLLTFETLFQELQHEFLIVLSEIVPYLSELLDDPTNEVRLQTFKLVTVIESILGESIEQYF